MRSDDNTETIKNLVVIDKERVDSSHTLDYLKQHNLNNSNDLDALSPLCYSENSEINFHLHNKTYYLNYGLEDSWNAYLKIPPELAWTGSKLAFSFTYDSSDKTFTYADDKYDGMKEDQLVFIVIKLLFGFFKLAVTHYVSKVSTEDKAVKLCYVEGGKSLGSQMISFERVSENKTRIIHITRYKSNSNFRDKILYPFIHEMIINQFHNNVKNYLDAK
jgi:hypothetical protein